MSSEACDAAMLRPVSTPPPPRRSLPSSSSSSPPASTSSAPRSSSWNGYKIPPKSNADQPMDIAEVVNSGTDGAARNAGQGYPSYSRGAPRGRGRARGNRGQSRGRSYHYVKPLPENATEKMKFIYQRQVLDARWRAASEFDEMMTKKHEAELKENAKRDAKRAKKAAKKETRRLAREEEKAAAKERIQEIRQKRRESADNTGEEPSKDPKPKKSRRRSKSSRKASTQSDEVATADKNKPDAAHAAVSIQPQSNEIANVDSNPQARSAAADANPQAGNAAVIANPLAKSAAVDVNPQARNAAADKCLQSVVVVVNASANPQSPEVGAVTNSKINKIVDDAVPQSEGRENSRQSKVADGERRLLKSSEKAKKYRLARDAGLETADKKDNGNAVKINDAENNDAMIEDAADGKVQLGTSHSAEMPEGEKNGSLAPPFRLPNGEIINTELPDEFDADEGLSAEALQLPFGNTSEDEFLMEIE